MQTTSYAFCCPKNDQLFLMHDHGKRKRGIKERFLVLKRKINGVFRLTNEEVTTQSLTA